jgi:putative aminopeptidase FrvX
MDSVTKEFLEILTELLALPSPSGREEKTREYIRGKLESWGIASKSDPAGNLLVRTACETPDGPLTIIAAHMDEIAVTVTGIEDNGDLRVINSGGLAPCKIGERPVEILTGTDAVVIGILSMGSAHSKEAREGKWAPGWGDMRVITGLSPAALKDKGVRPGSTAVPAAGSRGPYIFGYESDPMLAAWTLDDRAGVAELMIVLRELKKSAFKPADPLLLAFTVHEEGGCHGAKVLAMRERPEIFLAVDGCPITDSAALELDGRPGVWSKDSVCHYDQRLIKRLMEAAKEAGTELQTAVYTSAASDASAVYGAGGASRVALMGHVRANSHGFEAAKLSVFRSAINTLIKFIERGRARV